MNLLEYLKTLEKDAAAALALRCGTTPGHLKQVAYGYRKPNFALAISLDRETAGIVSCDALRPDIDWAHIRSPSSSKPAAA
jgi:DNA-binding transcriptional regulator YdaS (Cro superfamily)